MTGGTVLFFVAVILAVIGATLSVVVWLAREALAILAGWFLNWDRKPAETEEDE